MYNNYIHDVEGAGLGVWGCYDCLLAHNTLVRVGRRSHTIEVTYGPRICTGEAGGWDGWGVSGSSTAAWGRCCPGSSPPPPPALPNAHPAVLDAVGGALARP